MYFHVTPLDTYLVTSHKHAIEVFYPDRQEFTMETDKIAILFHIRNTETSGMVAGSYSRGCGVGYR
jgi:hypothetical protein